MNTKYLSTIGRYATPAAMVVFLTIKISGSITVTGWWIYAVLAGAFFTSVGIEVVGIQSGDTFVGFWSIGDLNKSAVAFILLCVYTIAAIYILKDNAVLLPVPIVAAVVYVVSALAESLHKAQEKQTTQETTRTAFDLEQERLDKEIERQLKLQTQADKTAVQIAKLQTKPAQVSPQVSASLPVSSGGFTHWRTIPHDVRLRFANMSPEEIRQENPTIAQRTAENWRNWSRELAVKVAENGHGGND